MRARTSALQRYLPVTYFALSMALVAALLPTALRPPPQQPPTSAELSPDAPPDDSVLLTDLQAGSSRTAGAGTAVGPGEKVIEEVRPIVEQRARRGRCFGDPPRQLESLYAPPCAAAWVGDNGGDTWRGVTQDEIRIGFLMNLTGNASKDGEITDDPEENDNNAQSRTYRVLKQYFNQNMELYGRKLRFFYVQSQREDDDPTTSRSAASRAVDEYGIFAAINETSVATLDELSRRGVITFTLGQMNRGFFATRRPYAWSATPDSTRLIELSSEYLCKKLEGKPPVHADDATFDYSAPRVFGMLAYQEGVGYEENVPLMREHIGKCGAEIKEAVEYGLGTSADASSFAGQAAGAVARMKAAGVTTIISFQDFISNTLFTQEADNAKYFPEWYVSGMGGTDRVDLFYQAYSPTQWKNAFGISVYEIPERASDSECARAYHSIDADTNADNGMCYYMWAQFVQLIGALQLAGPTLNPETFQAGLYAYGVQPPDPVWRMAGGYGPNDWTFPDYAAEVWYDPLAPHPNGRRGAYRFINGGKRYTVGEFTTDESPMFEDPGIIEMPRGD